MTIERHWVFSRRGFNDVEQEITEADQFNTETVPESEALVREATQNSQDARDQASGQPVQLRFALVKGPNIDRTLISELTAGLLPHLRASGIEIDDTTLHAPSALVIEDFGTEGLTGRIDDENDQGNFRSFWFRHGSSFKGGNKNGRWGLGKLVFPMASATRCFFGLTIRKGDPQALLLGQAALKTHQIDGVRYAPHGHFGDLGANDRLSPISDVSFIRRVMNGFNLKRTSESGLSVIVPYPLAETDNERLLEFVVRNYAYPILTRKLVVDVVGQRVDADSIRSTGRHLLKPGLIEFIEDVHGADRATLVSISERALGSAEKLTDAMVQDDVPTIRDRYAAGELLGFRVPLKLARKRGTTQTSYVEVFFRRRFDTEDGDALYVRGDITIPDEASRFHGAGAFAALIANDALVSEFLADAENPAHTRWLGTAKRANDNWKYAAQTLSVIRDALPALYRMLATGHEQVDARALTNFFWLDDPNVRSPATLPKPKPDRPKPGPMPPLPPTRRKLVLSKRKGGFALRPGPAFDEVSLPAQLAVTVSYDVEYGKPRWDKLDFDLADDTAFDVTVSGAEEERTDNRIVLNIDQREFELVVDGFDERRDLVVDYNLLKPEPALA